MGIIKSFKDKYYEQLRSDIIIRKELLKQDYASLLKKINLYEVMTWISKSVDYITQKTVFNCWKKSRLVGFEPSEEKTTETQQDTQLQNLIPKDDNFLDDETDESEEVPEDKIVEVHKEKTEFKDAFAKLYDLEQIILEHAPENFENFVELRNKMRKKFLQNQTKNTLRRHFFPI